MTPPIERLRYYDGEYLRAFDFSDEQTYHLEMRRRLNMALHLSGIVEGLNFTQDPDPPVTGVNPLWSMLPGMAIDGYGREILVFAPFVLDDTILSAKEVTGPKSYDIWVYYSKQATTPPTPGYANCNLSNEYTRWKEGFVFKLLPKQTTSAPNPAPMDPQSDDPTADQLGVQLGVAHVVTDPFGTRYIDKIEPTNRTYIGLRAQRIQPPDYPDSTSFDITQKNNPLLAPLGLCIESNVFVDQDLIVGPDFDVTTNPIQPALPSNVATSSGNAKIAADLFLQGEVYSLRQAGKPAANTWLSLGEYIKSFQPDVQASSSSVMAAVPGSGATQDSVSQGSLPPITLTSSLPQVDAKKVQVIASVAGVQYLAAFTGNLNTVGYSVSAKIAPVGTQPNTFNLTLNWKLSGAVLSGANWIPPFATLSINWVVVFYPQ
jgi:hypothetical protein